MPTRASDRYSNKKSVLYFAFSVLWFTIVSANLTKNFIDKTALLAAQPKVSFIDQW